MNVFKSLITICFISALALPVQAAGKLKIMDQGMDGNIRAYRVFCPDGSKGGITKKFSIDKNNKPQTITTPGGKVIQVDKTETAKLQEICAGKSDGKDTCRPNWTVDQAAQSICR